MWGIPYTHIFAIYDAINQYMRHCAICAVARIQSEFFAAIGRHVFGGQEKRVQIVQWQKIHKFKSTSLSILLKTYKLNAIFTLIMP